MTEQPYTSGFPGSKFSNMTSTETVENDNAIQGGEYDEMWQYRLMKRTE